jgi:AraC family transcriptional regulator
MPRTPLEPGAFLGRTVRSLQCDQISLVESRYGPRFRSDTHTHERAFCYLVLEGTCTETCVSRTRTCVASNLAYHPAGAPHSDYWNEKGGRCFHLEFGARWMDRVRDFLPALDRPIEFRGGMPVWLAAHLYRELRAPDDVSPLAIEGLSLELAAQFARQTAPKPESRRPAWLDRVVDLVESRFREPLTLDEMALEGGVHRVHLVTAFRQHLNCTPFDFLRKRRVEFAAAKLVNSQASRLDIALDAGFTDQSHFCKVFKAVTGMTPTAYQQLFARRS